MSSPVRGFAIRFVSLIWARIRLEWTFNGFDGVWRLIVEQVGIYGIRHLAARRITASWLQQLVDPFIPMQALGAAGRLSEAIEFGCGRLGSIETTSRRALRRWKIAWVQLADLLLIDGRQREAAIIYRRVVEASQSFTTVRWGLENLRRRDDREPAPRAISIHFFTIVLNGIPLIERHIEVMRKLPFDWHWHIVEGIAALRHDTAWSRARGGRAAASLHRNGLSTDGTSEYLDRLASEYPGRISIYRAPDGRAWDGKIEMVRAPLAAIGEECLLWQIDVDEFWTADQIVRMRRRFIDEPDRTAAFFLCHFFIRDLVVVSANTYGNHLEYEWLRVWRFRPGDFWLSHEPPRLCRRLERNRIAVDLATVNPFVHGETLRDDLVFRHLAYVLPAQLRFKETYYGYANALRQWQALPDRGPIRLRQHLSWIADDAIADSCESWGIVSPAADLSDKNSARCKASPPPTLFRSGKADISLAAARTILVIKLDNIGDSILLSPFLRELRANAARASITLMVREEVHNLVALYPHVDRVVPVAVTRGDGTFQTRDRAFMDDYEAHRFDLAIVPRWDCDEFGAGAIARRSGARRVVGFGEAVSRNKARLNRGYDENYTDVLLKITPDHEVAQNLALLTFMNGTAASNKLEVWLDAADRARASALTAPFADLHPRIAICPGASHAGKVFPLELLLRILDRLPQSAGFVLLGGKDDRGAAAFAKEHLGDRAIALCGETSLREAGAVLERCNVALTMDSALAHLAAATGTPLVVFSMHPRRGGNDTLDQSPARFGPWCAPERRLIVQPERAWPGCENGCRWRDVRPHCIANINVDAAGEAVSAFLAPYLFSGTHSNPRGSENQSAPR